MTDEKKELKKPVVSQASVSDKLLEYDRLNNAYSYCKSKEDEHKVKEEDHRNQASIMSLYNDLLLRPRLVQLKIEIEAMQKQK